MLNVLLTLKVSILDPINVLATDRNYGFFFRKIINLRVTVGHTSHKWVTNGSQMGHKWVKFVKMETIKANSLQINQQEWHTSYLQLYLSINHNMS
jgi:hypothetical protein